MSATQTINSNLIFAYRKAKADLYYSKNPRTAELLEYELNLQANLTELQNALLQKNSPWFRQPEFIGTFSVAPNQIIDATEESPKISGITYFTQNPPLRENETAPTAVFRLMEKCSIHFHVLSALWIMLVGSKLEEKLSKNVYANRLRRTADKRFNELSIGSFAPYYSGYRNWQDNGYTEIEKMLDSDIDAVAITTDIQGYFHNLNVNCLFEDIDVRLKELKVFSTNESTEISEFNPSKVHEYFKQAICDWNKTVSEKLGTNSVGLPVGLAASGLIANLALEEFDRSIQEEVKPRYYGRYVDDIFLVLEDSENFSCANDIWRWLAKRIKSLKLPDQVENNTQSEDNGEADHSKENKDDSVIPFLEVSSAILKLSENKTQIGKLDSKTGLQVLSSLKEAIRKNSSEWNFLPAIPNNSEDVANQIAKAIDDEGLHVQNLGKARNLSTDRAGFAILLRNFEALARDLDVDSWKPVRIKFYETIRLQILNPKRYFELENYFPRILNLALRCADWEHFDELFNGIKTIFENVKKHFNVEIKSISFLESTNREEVKCLILESWASNLETTIKVSKNSFHNTPQSLLKAVHTVSFPSTGQISTSNRQELTFSNLFKRDLASVPFKTLFVPAQIESSSLPTNIDCIPLVPELIYDLHALRDGLEKIIEIFSKAELIDKRKVAWNVHGLVFATRPLGVSEILLWTRLLNCDFESQSKLPPILKATRGYSGNGWLSETSPSSNKADKTNTKDRLTLAADHIPTTDGKVRIAIGSLLTTNDSMQMAARGTPNLTIERYKQITTLINNVLRTQTDLPHYLLLPEVSIPANWFIRFATRLMHKNISLIAGVEFLRKKEPHIIHNQMWSSLVHSELGFKSIAIYRQDKQRPAASEERFLWELDQLRLKPELGTWTTPPIVNHGDFTFATLICSELTNTKYRAQLRGKIDALMVAESNRDLNTFNSLVEATALDIHCYVAQANNRAFGDSRIRVPHKTDHKRDIVRIRGGLNDHFVTGEIDIHSLREFQSKYRAPDGQFKPLPDGFAEDMDKSRMRTP